MANGISNLTMLILANNPEIGITHAGPSKNGKFSGWITLGAEDRYRPILNTEAVFDSIELAEKHMLNLISEAKKTNNHRLQELDRVAIYS